MTPGTVTRTVTAATHAVGEPSTAAKPVPPADVFVLFGPGMPPQYADDFRHDAMCAGVDIEILGDGTAPVGLDAIAQLKASGRIGPNTQVVLQCHGINDETQGHILKAGNGPHDWVRVREVNQLIRMPPQGSGSAPWSNTVLVAACQHSDMYMHGQTGPVVVHGEGDFVTEIGNEAVSALIGYVGECKRTGAAIEPDGVFASAAHASAERIRYYKPGLRGDVVVEKARSLEEADPATRLLADDADKPAVLKALAETPLAERPDATPFHSQLHILRPGDEKLLRSDPEGVHARTRHGLTPLHRVASGYWKEAVKRLVELGADINASHAFFGTPMHVVVDKQRNSMVKEFLVHGGSVNAQDSAGNTPLHIAARGNSTDVSRTLVDAGADAETRNKAGQTPLDIAKSNSPKMLESIGKLSPPKL